MTSSIKNPLFFEASIMSCFWARLILFLFSDTMMLLQWDFQKKIVTMGTFEWLTNCFTDVFTCQSTDNWQKRSYTNSEQQPFYGVRSLRATFLHVNNMESNKKIHLEQHFFQKNPARATFFPKNLKKMSLLNWNFYYIEVL